MYYHFSMLFYISISFYLKIFYNIIAMHATNLFLALFNVQEVVQFFSNKSYDFKFILWFKILLFLFLEIPLSSIFLIFVII